MEQDSAFKYHDNDTIIDDDSSIIYNNTPDEDTVNYGEMGNNNKNEIGLMNSSGGLIKKIGTRSANKTSKHIILQQVQAVNCLYGNITS